MKLVWLAGQVELLATTGEFTLLFACRLIICPEGTLHLHTGGNARHTLKIICKRGARKVEGEIENNFGRKSMCILVSFVR